MAAPGQTWSSQPYTDYISNSQAHAQAGSKDAFDDARQRTQ